MVEPLDFAHHAGLAGLTRLPEHLNLANVRPVAPSCGEEDGAVVDVEDLPSLPAPLDGLEEELLGLPLAARPLVSLPRPLPEVPPLLGSSAGQTSAALQENTISWSFSL